MAKKRKKHKSADKFFSFIDCVGITMCWVRREWRKMQWVGQLLASVASGALT